MATKDKTFVKFTPEQAADYAAHRGHSYPTQLYEAIMDYHQGVKEVLIGESSLSTLHTPQPTIPQQLSSLTQISLPIPTDVGTGPGKVIFDLLEIGPFETALGTDTSPGMINEARKGAEKAGLSHKTTFLQGAGEEVDKTISSAGIGIEKVDVMTVAMAAHWMQMPDFYAAAARALRAGGTLAIWTCTSLYAHPSTPNVEAVQAALTELEDGILKDYHSSGTLITRSAYRNLDLPWTVSPPILEFAEKDFVRVDWDKDGIPSAPAMEDGTPGPFLKDEEIRLEDLEKGMGSASSVIRFRAANPELAGTEQDPVVRTISKMREAMSGRESLGLRPSTHLLLLRRS